MTFYHPTDGYLYGWRWCTGEEAWWSTVDLALRHPRDVMGQAGEPIRRRYVVGEVEAWALEAGGPVSGAAVHPAASVLADHQPIYVTASTAPGTPTRCCCLHWSGPWYKFGTHQTEVLAEAGLLGGGGTPAETATTRREGRG